MAIYSGFSHWKWWFSIVMLVYRRVNITTWFTIWLAISNGNQWYINDISPNHFVGDAGCLSFLNQPLLQKTTKVWRGRLPHTLPKCWNSPGRDWVTGAMAVGYICIYIYNILYIIYVCLVVSVDKHENNPSLYAALASKGKCGGIFIRIYIYICIYFTIYDLTILMAYVTWLQSIGWERTRIRMWREYIYIYYIIYIILYILYYIYYIIYIICILYIYILYCILYNIYILYYIILYYIILYNIYNII